MLRPKQMSKVSVTGSKRFMDDVVETVHDLHLLDVTDYDDAWEGFSPGDPIPGAEEASDKLVTIRSIESILDIGGKNAGPTRIVTDEDIEAELAEVRTRVNDLDDRRDGLESRLRDIEDRMDTVEPFARLGIDLDLLSGYRTLQVAVGRGDPDAVERAVADADEVRDFDVFSEGDVVAVFARPTEGAPEDALDDALVGSDFAALSVPDAEGTPEEYIDELQHRRQEVRSELDTVENDLQEIKLDAGGFILAAEEKLSIDIQKTEAPLSFATTENAFVAEGWVPTDRYPELASALDADVGDHVEVEELERARFSADGRETVRERPTGGAGGEPTAAADGGSESEVRADGGPANGAERESADGSSGTSSASGPRTRADGGGNVTMKDDSPPVIQDNPGVIKPFEVLVEAVSRPQYREFDPTVILFLTFPAFFGFMIGDFGYGVLYTLIGYYLYTNFDSPGFRSMGGVTIFAGLFTILFGILYGEIFGLHIITEYVWSGVFGLEHAPIEKGLSPAGKGWALAWLTVSVLVGILHLNIGWILDFVENLEFHDAKHAVLESGSWLLMMNGLWLWVFSLHGAGSKPNFLYTIFDGTGAAPEASGEFVGSVVNFGFNGFPAVVGYVGLAALAVGAVFLVVGEPAELPEIFNVLVNVLSYTRLAAVLLAKAGMAFTVNLLFFGAYVHDGEFHFLLDHGPQWVVNQYGAEALMFGGLIHGGVLFALVGLLVLVLGHVLVLALGVTSAGLQAVRLEYVEFFGKFYEGGGREYEPFGYDRRYTTED